MGYLLFLAVVAGVFGCYKSLMFAVEAQTGSAFFLGTAAMIFCAGMAAFCGLLLLVNIP